MFLGLSDSLLGDCWDPRTFSTRKWTALGLSTRERKYDDVSYSNGVLASVTTRNKEEEMPVQKYVIELMGQST